MVVVLNVNSWVHPSRWFSFDCWRRRFKEWTACTLGISWRDFHLRRFHWRILVLDCSTLQCPSSQSSNLNWFRSSSSKLNLRCSMNSSAMVWAVSTDSTRHCGCYRTELSIEIFLSSLPFDRTGPVSQWEPHLQPRTVPSLLTSSHFWVSNSTVQWDNTLHRLTSKFMELTVVANTQISRRWSVTAIVRFLNR